MQLRHECRHQLRTAASRFLTHRDGHDSIPRRTARDTNPLGDSGVRDNRDLPSAIWTYNHSTAYVNQVLDTALRVILATQSKTVLRR